MSTVPGTPEVSSQPAVSSEAAAPIARPGTLAMLVYVLPTVAAGTVVGPVTAILPTLYAKYTRVTLAALGSLFILVRKPLHLDLEIDRRAGE